MQAVNLNLLPFLFNTQYAIQFHNAGKYSKINNESIWFCVKIGFSGCDDKTRPCWVVPPCRDAQPFVSTWRYPQINDENNKIYFIPFNVLISFFTLPAISFSNRSGQGFLSIFFMRMPGCGRQMKLRGWPLISFCLILPSK